MPQGQRAMLLASLRFVFIEARGKPAKGALGQLPELDAGEKDEYGSEGEGEFPRDFCAVR